ncbi:MAG: antibiotic biosynthesis monooxygenase [Verrucomicrobia bacterium]|nr:MAG: antibiotic biosynthesis monooxygenase [Verrucomicrobiota bacterium]
MIHVIATIDLIPGKRDAFLEEFHRLIPQVQAEKGCLEYTAAVDVATGVPVQSPARPNTVTVIEKWADLPSLEAHLNAPHVAAYRERVKNMLAGLKLQILQPA